MVGICAMTKKSNSKPMTQILERLCKFDYIDVVIFPEEVILEEPVENWPLCDCLISFHSKGNSNLLKVLISPQLQTSLTLLARRSAWAPSTFWCGSVENRPWESLRGFPALTGSPSLQGKWPAEPVRELAASSVSPSH